MEATAGSRSACGREWLELPGFNVDAIGLAASTRIRSTRRQTAIALFP